MWNNSLCSVAKSHLTLGKSLDYSPSGSSVLGIFWTRIVELSAISFSRGYSWPKEVTSPASPALAGEILYHGATWETLQNKSFSPQIIYWASSHSSLATWWDEPTYWKRPWCWERLKARGEGDDRGWDGWMASPTQWTWVWVNSGSWWWTGRPGVLRFMGSQRVRNDLVTEQQIIQNVIKPHFYLLIV